MAPLTLAYYCSGHGYGHATRVTALACHLRALPEEIRPIVHITSSAPKAVFHDAIECGVDYREALIDPVIVQPIAYRVDRQRSVEVLKSFLGKKDTLVKKEAQWLKTIQADCILSDAAFLGCLAANAAHLPSILITNFSFDSIYSFLSTSISDSSQSLNNNNNTQHLSAVPIFDDLIPDEPISLDELAPLVNQLWQGYRCADLLILLPGHIPIPSFTAKPLLPSSNWIDPDTLKVRPETLPCFGSCQATPDEDTILPCLPFDTTDFREPHDSPHTSRQCSASTSRRRQIVNAPLLVRRTTRNPSPYVSEGRRKLLLSIGIPENLHDPLRTKILIVSFGGQPFKRPSHSRSGSRNASPAPTIGHSPERSHSPSSSPTSPPPARSSGNSPKSTGESSIPSPGILSLNKLSILSAPHRPLATPSHILIPNAPPVLKPRARDPSLSPSISPRSKFLSPPASPFIDRLDDSELLPTLITSPPTPNLHSRETSAFFAVSSPPAIDEEPFIDLLPDDTWIAIICGVSKEQWLAQQEADADDDGLPERFYVAPKDIYMPDLTAVGDVLLGKLGYGLVSEVVSTRTPCVFVSRPLFIEEHGLRQYLCEQGVGVELSRQSYEQGEWAYAVLDAYLKGKEKKEWMRNNQSEVDALWVKEEKEGREMAKQVIDWVEEWQRLY